MHKLILSLAIGVFLLFTVIHPFKDSHVLFNLEPYPDGLFYIHAARNLALHHKWEVSYEGYLLQPRITPTYSVLLAAGYFFSEAPQMFYVVNVLLGVLTMTFLFLLLQRFTKNPTFIGIGLLIYLSHAYLYWLPSAPMAENASLFLFTASMWAVLRKKHTFLSSVFASLLLIVLFLTKYTLFGPVGVLAIVLLLHLWTEKKQKEMGATVITFILGAVFFFVYQNYMGYNPLSVLSPKVFNQVSTTKHIFYSFSYLSRNIVGYWKMLLGIKTNLLWLQYPFTTFGLSVFFLLGNMYLFWKQKSKKALLLLVLFFSQFPILLVFYVIDARYIILTLPLLAIGIVHVLEKIKKKQWIYIFLGLLIVIQLISQLSFFKYLIATNLLNRSTAWQYQAVKVFNTQFEKAENHPYLITALPPLFVDLYSNHNYQLLPLSSTQEFADKKQFVWGREIEYDNLGLTYTNLLVEGKELFVTNAYLTSQHEFDDYFKQIEKRFVLTEVANGCLGTCKVWKVKLRLIVD